MTADLLFKEIKNAPELDICDNMPPWESTGNPRTGREHSCVGTGIQVSRAHVGAA